MEAVREGGAIHTEGEWFAGGGSWVATSHVVDGGIGGSDDVDYYGGHLIGESISSCNIPIISAAPDMFKALLAVKQKLHFIGMPGEKVCEVTGKSDWSDQIKLIEAALTKAVTRVPVPAIIAPVSASTDISEGYRVIGDNETLIEGDEYSDAISPGSKHYWHSVVLSIGAVKRSSSLCDRVCRRKVPQVDPVPSDVVQAAPSVDVGEGWRVIGDDELLFTGDQHSNGVSLDSVVTWMPVGLSAGVVKGKSFVRRFVCRRKVAPVEPVAAPESDPDCVGIGYRLISADEVFIEGDEFDNNTGLPKPLWLTVESNIGRLKRDSTLANNRCRRKVEPADQDSVGVGYRIVGQDETLIAGDEYWNKLYSDWDQLNSEVGKQKQVSCLSQYRVRRCVVNDGDPVDAEFEVLEQQKPPLGLMPRQIWLENRRDDIYDAIARYRASGKDVSRDWLNELLDLDNEMRPF